ncbi:sensor histidine kinase [Clostridium fungisolvens]|uniref:histidine kinase n=1 Tax=Clostridium fungisolvens TaxID=1604897 RepID=A0A6V8SJ03_9CLOT|nr:HAMP domain-containing sensor histidine kinase [Clostridium fungisolvens]GFP74873.1 Sensor histidine kinase CssS [Clostridium fungisolvens]
MKNKSLTFQVWSVSAGIIAGVFICLVLYFNISISSFFTDETYKTIELAQDTFLQSKNKDKNLELEEINTENIGMIQDTRSVTQVVYPYQNLNIIKRFSRSSLTNDLMKIIEKETRTQNETSKRYDYKLSSGRLYYVIKKTNFDGKDSYLISFMMDTYRNKLVKDVTEKLIVGGIIAIMISLMVSMAFSNYITAPIKFLESRVKRIAKQDWYDSLKLERGDELGGLAESIEDMRIQLIKRDEWRQNMLQQVSHELKTPVMVIRNYVQAVEDGIYPNGTLEGTMKVIDEEAIMLQKRIKDLLQLSKLEYVNSKPIKNQLYSLCDVISDVFYKIKANNMELQWDIETLEDALTQGDKEQFTIVLENLLDNASRYAKKKVEVSLYIEQGKYTIRIYNDGEEIEEKDFENLFLPFTKGKNGKYGLGLSIVKEIVQYHGANIQAKNEHNGVAFYIDGIKNVE